MYPEEKLCIWVRAYLRLKAQNKEDEIGKYVVPPCDWELWQTSSWINYFLGRDHSSKRLGIRPPRVEKDRHGDAAVVVRVADLLTGRLDLEVPIDLLVLATGVVPHDISELVTMYSCAVGYDSFLLEVHPKLRPVELAVSGVFLAGCCQGPMDITECTAAASVLTALRDRFSSLGPRARPLFEPRRS